MINTVKSSMDLGDPSDRQSDRRQDPRERGSVNTQAATPGPQPDVRLIIEQSPETGALVYKLVDRRTGAVISVVSRAELLNMISDPAYTAGAVIDTKA
jgi:hypothetical protein